jgi:hypothetical protein
VRHEARQADERLHAPCEDMAVRSSRPDSFSRQGGKGKHR